MVHLQAQVIKKAEQISANIDFETDFSKQVWDNGLKENLAEFLDTSVSKLEKNITYCAVQSDGHASFGFKDNSLIINLDEVDDKANEQLDMGMIENWDEAVEFVLDEFPIDFYLDLKDNSISSVTLGE